MTTPRPASSRRSRTRANGDGTVYQRKDGRWEAAGYVLAPGNTRKRVRVYGTTRKDATTKLTEKIAASNRGLPIAAADSTVSAYLTYWLDGVAVHHLRENTHTRYAASIRLHLNPGLGSKKLARLTTPDVRTFLGRTPHHLPVLHPGTRRCSAVLLRHRPVLRQAAVPADGDVRPRGPQVRPGTRRPRGRTAAQRRPQRQDHHAPPQTLPAPHRHRSPAVPPVGRR